MAGNESDREQPWCYWQEKCVEDKEPGQWTCLAQLAEGRALQCHKKDMKDARSVPRCEDAEPWRERETT